MPKLKDLTLNDRVFTPGHRACSGCGASIALRQVLLTAGPDTVAAIATGCMEVVSTIFPYTSWGIPLLHVAFENAAAAISGIEACYRAFKRKGKVKKKINFIAFAGDGGTYDIGIQALSGALERGHDFLYVCYNNEAYMNTGIQRSGATPKGAHTTTSPAGKVIPGKVQSRKDLTEIVVAHNIPYAAQATISNWADLTRKVEKALSIEGPTFLNILCPCPLGWRFLPDMTVEIARLAVESKIWPLYEVENGKYRITYTPKKEVRVEEWLKLQGRFKHLFTPQNRHVIDELQEEVMRNWERLQRKAECLG